MLHRMCRMSARSIAVITALLVAAVLPGTAAAPHVQAALGGTLYGWGNNYGSELGYHPALTTSISVRVHLPAGARVTSLAAVTVPAGG